MYILFVLIFFSCGSAQVPSQIVSGDPGNLAEQQLAGGIAEEIRDLTETGILSSMLYAIELIHSKGISGTEFGRLMTGINVILINMVYPDSLTRLPVVDLPQTHSYARIIREAQRGNYFRPAANSIDFFEHILPFLAINEQIDAEILPTVLRDLEKAQRLQPNSVLPLYFQGLVHERAARFDEAVAAFRQAYEISNEIYPTLIGIARVRRLAGYPMEAIAKLSDLVVRYPDSMEIKKELAIGFYENREFPRALSAIDEILRTEPGNGEFLLMRASILIEQGQFSQANVSLDNYASINRNNRSFLFMRARVQFEGNRNRDSALNYLRSILYFDPGDAEVMIYAANLLMESPSPADQSEGRELIEILRQISGSSIEMLSFSLRDAVSRESWQEAQVYLNRILDTRRTSQDLIDGYHIERGLQNNARALGFARELYEQDNSNHDYTFIFISALIDNGRRDEASRLVENRLNSTNSSQARSRYFFLRSRLQTNQDVALNDLRSSLFEDPGNLDTIIAMFEIHHNRREERRAVHYLRQALAITPNHPQLQRYESEYASLLGRN
jgi:tetratricopeptide (TPR) repeat protein